MIERARAGKVLALTEQTMPSPAAIADGLRALIEAPAYDESAVDGSAFDSLSARASAKALADALDRACARRPS
jgi:hypothetical protein